MLFHLFIFFSLMNWSIPSYSGGKLTIKMIHVHDVIQCHSQSNMQKLVRNSVSCHQCKYFLHFSSFYLPSPILHFSFPPMFRRFLCPAKHFRTQLSQEITIPPVLARNPYMLENSEHDNRQLVFDQHWHVQNLTECHCVVDFYLYKFCDDIP